MAPLQKVVQVACSLGFPPVRPVRALLLEPIYAGSKSKINADFYPGAPNGH